MARLTVFTSLIFFFTIEVNGQFTSEKMKWYKQPDRWKIEGSKLMLTAEPKTDYWQKTHYGYSTDNGHFYFTECSGDFEAVVKLSGEYKDLYDQAGLMVRIDKDNWIKSGVEFVDGGINISAVYTREFSDWSVIPGPDKPLTVWLKLVRKNDSVELSYSTDGTEFHLQRLGYFPPKQMAMIGVMAAAPEGGGFVATFEDFQLRRL